MCMFLLSTHSRINWYENYLLLLEMQLLWTFMWKPLFMQTFSLRVDLLSHRAATCFSFRIHQVIFSHQQCTRCLSTCPSTLWPVFVAIDVLLAVFRLSPPQCLMVLNIFHVSINNYCQVNLTWQVSIHYFTYLQLALFSCKILWTYLWYSDLPDVLSFSMHFPRDSLWSTEGLETKFCLSWYFLQFVFLVLHLIALYTKPQKIFIIS